VRVNARLDSLDGQIVLPLQFQSISERHITPFPVIAAKNVLK
jgi:hypothetical protein